MAKGTAYALIGTLVLAGQTRVFAGCLSGCEVGTSPGPSSFVVPGFVPPQFGKLILTARTASRGDDGAAEWRDSVDFLFKIPSTVRLSRGRAGEGYAFLDFRAGGSDVFRCVYKGNGDDDDDRDDRGGSCRGGSSYNSNSSSSVDDVYVFYACYRARDFGSWDEGSCRDRYSRDNNDFGRRLNIMDGDTVFANWIGFSLAKGDDRSSSSNKVVASIILENFNHACGGVALAQGSVRKLPWDKSSSRVQRDATVHILDDLGCDAIIDHTQPPTGPNNCYEYGPGLTVVGADYTVEGYGKRIRARRSAIGLLVNGPDATVRNVTVSGLTDALNGDTASTGVRGGAGLMAYDTRNLVITNSVFDGNRIGMDVFGEDTAITGLDIRGNWARGSSLFGVRVRGERSWLVRDPLIDANDLSNSAAAGMQLTGLATFNVSGNYRVSNPTLRNNRNVFRGSPTGFFLAGGAISVRNLDMSTSGVSGNQIFVAGASRVTIANSNLSASAPPTPAGIRVGAHLYNVATVDVNGLKANGGDIGLKVAIDAGSSLPRDVSVQNSDLKLNVNAGIWLQSYDGTPFGTVRITQNDLSGYFSGFDPWYNQNIWYGAWIIPGTTAGSLVLSGNLQ